MAWLEAGSAAEIAAQGKKTLPSPIGSVTVFHVDGTFYALEDACPHQGASLGEGLFHDGRVICPWHSWVFDVNTGECPRGTHEPARTVPVRTVGQRVEIEVPDATT